MIWEGEAPAEPITMRFDRSLTLPETYPPAKLRQVRAI